MTVFAIASHAAAIGTWKAYLAYHDITEVERAGNTVFVLASKNLFSYNTNDQSLQTYDKINALSDSDIKHIKWNNAAQRLVIVYENSNIDLLSLNGNSTNVSDLYAKSLTQDKTVNDIYIYNNYAYLAVGFGIIKLNVSKAEISDTYNLSFNVDYCYISGNKIYAASATNGIYEASLSDNLLDKSVWSRSGDYVTKDTSVDEELLTLAKSLNPGGPKYSYFGFMRFTNGKLYTVGGGFTQISDMLREGCVQVLDGDDWTIYEDDLEAKTGVLYLDLAAVDVDPKDENHVFASGRTGLYEFNNGIFTKHYDYKNSPIERYLNTYQDYQLVLGCKFDADGNLWCLNSLASSQSLLELKTDGTWVSHSKKTLMRSDYGSLERMGSMFFDSRGLLWFGNNYWALPALFCYDTENDEIWSFENYVNEDGTTISSPNGVCDIAEDLDHNIWFSTYAGPLMLETSQMNNSNYYFTQVKVPRNDGTNYADYLLDGIAINCMAVDGAGRKWFGTNGNGVYLISADNLTQLQHFTSDNSKLTSDVIESIAINDQTGEVFFGTDKGLCSYMSDANAAISEMTDDNVYAYPNPVRPDYTGVITVTGLTLNADVKIVTSNGVLVNEGKSNGGIYTWDGCDLKGKRVASGIYFVETATADGKKGTVCKIAIVR